MSIASTAIDAGMPSCGAGVMAIPVRVARAALRPLCVHWSKAPTRLRCCSFVSPDSLQSPAASSHEMSHLQHSHAKDTTMTNSPHQNSDLSCAALRHKPASVAFSAQSSPRSSALSCGNPLTIAATVSSPLRYGLPSQFSALARPSAVRLLHETSLVGLYCYDFRQHITQPLSWRQNCVMRMIGGMHTSEWQAAAFSADVAAQNYQIPAAAEAWQIKAMTLKGAGSPRLWIKPATAAQ